jgi:BCD family chlorophyll transporter-like MFS transporter
VAAGAPIGLGGIVVLVTATMNRVMVVELALPAVLPGALVGLGVSAAGTALLALLARRAAAIVWLMMFAGFALTATLAGHWLQPFSARRLLVVTAATVTAALLLTLLAVWGIEGAAAASTDDRAARPAFRLALAQVWAEQRARHFTLFIFISVLAYSAQELLLEPFAGRVFQLPPGVSAQLTGLQHGGSFALGGLLGTGASDAARLLAAAPATAYALVFAIAAALFLMAAQLAVQVFEGRPHAHRPAVASTQGPRHAPG